MNYEFKEGDHVRIKAKNIVGQIIDISESADGCKWYTVENDVEGFTDDPDAWIKGPWSLFDCTADQLEWLSSEEWND